MDKVLKIEFFKKYDLVYFWILLGTHGQFLVHFGSFDLTLLEYPQNCPWIPFGTQNYTA